MSRTLSFDRLRRIQQTLSARALERDPGNIQSIGFAPEDARKRPSAASGMSTIPVVAQYDVWKKRRHVSSEKRIAARESLRLLHRSTGKYQQIELATDVQQADAVIPTGVRISVAERHATAAVVVRWSTEQPAPPRPISSETLSAGDRAERRWRWGVLTVSHLFAAAGQGSKTQTARLQRKVVCGDGPASVEGRVVVRGRIPGGPDIGLVETGLDRLWLSGFLPRVELPEVAVASEAELMRWSSRGTTGELFAEHRRRSWNWLTFYPSLSIDGLGRLTHIVRYRLQETQDDMEQRGGLGPGTSGGVLVAGGIPIGIQVAAMQPHYRIGYAQCFAASMPWLKARLRASSLAIVRIVT